MKKIKYSQMLPTTKIDYSVVKEKLSISDILLDIKEEKITFKIKKYKFLDLLNLQLVIQERRSKIRWIKKLTSNSIKSNGVIVINVGQFIQKYSHMVSRWDFYLIEECNDLGVIKEYRIGLFDRDVQFKHMRYFQSFVSEGTNLVTPYLTTKNGFSLVIKNYLNLSNEKLSFRMKLLKFNMNNSTITGHLKLKFLELKSYEIKSLLLIYRNKNENIKYEFQINEVRKKNYSSVYFCLDISNLLFENYYWDFYLVIQVDGEEFFLRIKNPSFKVKKKINHSIRQSYTYDNGYWIYPYITAVNSIALIYKEKEKYESEFYRFKERLAYLFYIIFKFYFDRKKIWLAFEKFSESAQDNAYFFFKYCYEHNKKDSFYYIIKKDSSDYKNLFEMDDKVIEYMSFKYMVYLYAAKLLISSESKGHVYNIRAQRGRIKQSLKRKKLVFLQHGVIGLKKVDHIFKKTSSNAVNLFVVSSNYEKSIIRDNFGYKDEEIILTGLSRWDQLTDKSCGKKTILLMPTWRSWMDDWTEEKFIKTEYYRQYTSLLNSLELERILVKYDIELNFYIHPKFKAYISKFSSANKRVKVYKYGEEKVNELLMSSSLLVTDYSSVAWDMYYQKKPVIFYQFDYEDYKKYQGSYLNMEKEIFGDRVFSLSGLLTIINEYAVRGFKEKKEFADKRNNYFAYIDSKNSERIFENIIQRQDLLKRRVDYDNYLIKLNSNKLIHKLWQYMKRNSLTSKLALNIKSALLKEKF
ncbi:hypothetical protein G4D61_05295 [Bacillus ginsengihumi]|uniref:CDP-glycerol:poly(Glycerophosphate) glycerophosphotransferase n=1 Tax=Heyndrickxia ginsengihumi TaxID=363870 RepID=A0A6M0P4I7_9BACI|nr:hypothetical protein [Heyndrickxia ginsengihumi]